ncbi:hypothetical protein R3P38DRAFT_3337746 [Favolaschia claudopus]|uniref:Uncharacterized protein n=1 Tax=Favolaschia claudopus TaxID=2862362 RepID=A0AAV9Z0D8_9AGAR
MSEVPNPATASSQNPPAAAPTLEEIRAATRAAVKEKIAESALHKAKKRKIRNDDDEPLTYHWYGRNLVRNGCGPYERFHPVVEFIVKYELTDPDELVEPVDPEEIRLLENWEIIKGVIPGFVDDMINLGGDVKLRRAVCAQLEGGAHGSRSDDTVTNDTGGLKKAILDYLLPPPPPPPLRGQDPAPLPVLTPAISKTGKKAPRGLNHPVTAAALRPIAYPDAPETYKQMKDGNKNFKILGRKLPAFMRANPDLKTTWKLAVRHIYLGPSAALEAAGSGKGRAGNAAINGVRSFTGRDIAYVACQVRFAMSSVESWSPRDDEFLYREFYWKVVDSLGGEEGQAILDRFNKDVFGNVSTDSQSNDPADDDEDEFNKMEQQRAAKRARLSQEASTPST